MTAPSLAERVVFAASQYVGMREQGGSNRGPPLEMFAGGRVEPWCAHFVAFLFREAGAPLPGDVRPGWKVHNPIAKVATMLAELDLAGFTVKEPKPGDIIFFHHRMGSDPGTGWHVGLVTAVENGLVQTIEGNSGDSVARRVYPLRDKHIAGYARIPG